MPVALRRIVGRGAAAFAGAAGGGRPKIFYRGRDGRLYESRRENGVWTDIDVTALYQSGVPSLVPAEWAEVTTWSGQIAITQDVRLAAGLTGTHSAQGTVTLTLTNSSPSWQGTFDYTAQCQLTARNSDGSLAYTESGNTAGSIPFAFSIAQPNLFLALPNIHVPTTIVLADGSTTMGIFGTITWLGHVWGYRSLPSEIGVIGGTSSLTTSTRGDTIDQVVQWSFVPTARAAFKTAKAWINSYIPGEIPGFTLTVPAGEHAGETMIPGPVPGVSDCFLTDQRGPSSDIGASSRIHSELESNLYTGVPTPNSPYHRCFPTVEVNCEQGTVDCTKESSTANVHATAVLTPDANGPGAPRLTMTFTGAASNPCFTGAPDIDYSIKVVFDVNPDRETGTLSFQGVADRFPEFEMYYALNNGPVGTIFVKTLAPGATPFDLAAPPEPLAGGSLSIAWP